jgi:branched-chain amino acid transport system ATP-binding protein
VQAPAFQRSSDDRSVEPGRTLLEVRDVSLRFGGVSALDSVGFSVQQGAVHALIGPNGAGKSSVLNCISGIYRPQSGSVVVHDRAGSHELIGLKPSRIARLGIARSFQNIELFKHLTALENLMLGRHLHMKNPVIPALLWWGPARAQEERQRRLVEEVIDLLELQRVRHRPVGSLPYGLQKRVELGRALCMQPELLLLDEPMAGMNPDEKEDMVRYVLDVHELAGVTVLLIEHDMDVVMDISDRVTVLDFGRRIADGTPAEVRSQPAVIDAYLGRDVDAG